MKKQSLKMVLACLLLGLFLAGCAQGAGGSVPQSETSSMLESQTDNASSNSQSFVSNVAVSEDMSGFAAMNLKTVTPVPGARNWGVQPNFNGAEYTWHRERAVSNQNALFFLARYNMSDDSRWTGPENLYYSDGKTVYLVMEKVYGIAGVDVDGLYLIVHDSAVKRVSQSWWADNERTASLLHYNLRTGATQHFISEVQYAVVLGNALFYSRVERYAIRGQRDSDYSQDVRIIIIRRELLSGIEKIVFADVPIATEYTGGELVDLAFWAEFRFVDGVLLAYLPYPYPSEFPYPRYLKISGDGEIVADTEKTPVKVYESRNVYKGHYQLRDYQVRCESYTVQLISQGEAWYNLVGVKTEKRQRLPRML